MMAKLCFELQHLIQKRPSQTEINPVTIEHKQGPIWKALRIINRVIRTHCHLWRPRHWLEIARQQEKCLYCADRCDCTYTSRRLLVGLCIKAHGHAGIAPRKEIAMRCF